MLLRESFEFRLNQIDDIRTKIENQADGVDEGYLELKTNPFDTSPDSHY